MLIEDGSVFVTSLFDVVFCKGIKHVMLPPMPSIPGVGGTLHVGWLGMISIIDPNHNS